mgnify:CR=1 FL=1|tara:strand:+ start:1599 stop:2522 length:924 start_codon:yes stop_codon:yes gene_type:complete
MSWLKNIVETNIKGASSSIQKSFSGVNKELEGLSKIDLGTPNLNQIKLNTDQDLSPFVKGAVVLASTAAGAAGGVFIGSPLVGAAAGAEIGQNLNQNLLGSRYDPSVDGGKIQKAVTGTTGDIQREAVNIGKGIQQAAIVNTSDLQERAVNFADRNDLGRNPTLEKFAQEVTHTVEEGAAEATKVFETNAAGVTAETEQLASGITTTAEDAADIVSTIYDALTGKADDQEPLDAVTADFDATDLNPEDSPEMTKPFDETETSTSKDDAMTEEERLAMIRRLLLNRYGREDTILGGGRDTRNRRTYAL